MISRRRFIGSSTAVVAGVTAPIALHGTGRRDEGTPVPEQNQDLPPSIAALESMADHTVPITTEERLQRIDKARRLMHTHGLDALFMMGGTTMRYFANMSWGGGERLFGIAILASGDAFVVCPAFEEDRARERLAEGPFAADTDVLTWEEDESPYALVASGLRARGVSTGRLGIEETVRYVFSDGIADAAPALELTSGTPVTAGCRAVKDEHELDLMRLASAATLKAYEAVYQALEAEMTQGDVSRLISLAHERLGFRGGASVQVGEYTALPHGSSTPQVVREGTIILIDGGCSAEGYRSDISRTFALGTPTEKMRRVFEIERRAQDAALAAARPGVECQAVDAAARQVIDEAGYGPGYAYFTHRVGHGLGMDGHEWPYLVKGNTLPLEPGMTFSDEPGIYIRGEFGVRLEDDMVITEDGAELFTPQSPSLDDPFGTD
jgi:Xaa-Pro dipeptidase